MKLSRRRPILITGDMDFLPRVDPGFPARQTAPRHDAQFVEWDDRAGGLAKVGPLVDWTEADVRAYVHGHDVP